MLIHSPPPTLGSTSPAPDRCLGDLWSACSEEQVDDGWNSLGRCGCGYRESSLESDLVALPQPCRVALSKAVPFSEPQFPHL